MSENWWSDSLAYAARTDVGMRRSKNQDSYCALPAETEAVWRERGHLFIVADGMGAHAAGEVASQLATQIVSESYFRRAEQTPVDALRDSILEAHETIKRRGNEDAAQHGMGTTCDALLLLPQKTYIGHVGDSRVYRLRDRVIEQMTFDHSLVWEVRHFPEAHLAYRQGASIPKNVITRSLGPTDYLTVALEGPFETRPGDVFLLCSDGLSGQVADGEIGQILELFQPEEAVEALVNLANLRGGPDNITVVVARLKSDPDGLPAKEKTTPKKEKKELKKAVLPRLLAVATCVFLAAFIASFFIAGLAWKIASLTAALLCAGAFAFFARKALLIEVEENNKSDAQFLGRGPYVRASAAPTEAFSKNIERVCAELCAAIREDRFFTPDWQGVENAIAQAKAATEAKKFEDSIRANFSVVNYFMRELRKYAESKKTEV